MIISKFYCNIVVWFSNFATIRHFYFILDIVHAGHARNRGLLTGHGSSRHGQKTETVDLKNRNRAKHGTKDPLNKALRLIRLSPLDGFNIHNKANRDGKAVSEYISMSTAKSTSEVITVGKHPSDENDAEAPKQSGIL